MDYYTLTDPVTGDWNLVDQTNKLAINIERLNAERSFYGALYNSRSSIEIADSQENYLVNWEDALTTNLYYDKLQILDQTDFTDFVVPAGFRLAKCYASFPLLNSGGRVMSMQITKNGDTTFPVASRDSYDGLSGYSIITTPWLQVTAYDIFQLHIDNTGIAYDTAANPYGTLKFFSIELRK